MSDVSRPLETLLLDGKCPDCAHDRFHKGPEGGLSTNIKCAKCGSCFNVVPRCAVMPHGFVERIGDAR